MINTIRCLALLWGLLPIAWNDYMNKRIPNRMILDLLVFRILILLMECLLHQEYWIGIFINACTGFLCGGGLLLLCYLITKGGIGAGDVKLFAVLGCYLGSGRICIAAFLSFFISAFYCIIGWMRKKKSLKQEIPLGPFVLIGTMLTVMFGMQLPA